jgi:hypothetical protein
MRMLSIRIVLWLVSSVGAYAYYALDQSKLTLNAEIVFKSDDNFGLKSVYACITYLLCASSL